MLSGAVVWTFGGNVFGFAEDIAIRVATTAETVGADMYRAGPIGRLFVFPPKAAVPSPTPPGHRMNNRPGCRDRGVAALSANQDKTRPCPRRAQTVLRLHRCLWPESRRPHDRCGFALRGPRSSRAHRVRALSKSKGSRRRA